jgi:hypothetical protein
LDSSFWRRLLLIPAMLGGAFQDFEVEMCSIVRRRPVLVFKSAPGVLSGRLCRKTRRMSMGLSGLVEQGWKGYVEVRAIDRQAEK